MLTPSSCVQWGPEITGDPDLRERAHFHPFALGPIDQHAENDTTKIWALDSLMNLNGAHASCPHRPSSPSLSHEKLMYLP